MDELTHKMLHRQKVLAKRKAKKERRQERQKANKKNIMSEQHRINYYLKQQVNHPVDDKDENLTKYYRQRSVINREKERKKRLLSKCCIGCFYNKDGWCKKEHLWCDKAVLYCNR